MSDTTTTRDRQQLADQVTEMIADLLGFESDEYELTDSFADDLEADSLAMVQLRSTVEETFDIVLDDSEIAELTTPALLIDFITARRTAS